MKKKILIVFLICCMFFGVASPAMAANDYQYYTGLYDGHYVWLGETSTSVMQHYPSIVYAKDVGGLLGFQVQLTCPASDVSSPVKFDSFYSNSSSDISLYIDITGFESVNFNHRFTYYYPYNNDKGFAQGVTSLGSFSKVSVDDKTYLRCVLPDISSNSPGFSPIYTLSTSDLTFIGSCSSVYVWDNGSTNQILGELPPQMMELGITQIQVTTGQQVVGMIQTLLPYGISCLALLITLPLLLKVLRRFLG